MKTITTSLFLLALAGSPVFADCAAPSAPAMPDGAKASMEEMLAGKKSVAEFQQSNASYMQCLSKQMESLKADLQSGDKDAQAKAQGKYAELTDTYNAAVSAEEQLAGQFNQAVRAYKAANP